MVRRLRGAVAAAAVAVALAACGASGAQRDPLIYHLRNYNEGVRWGQFDKAALNVPVLEREDFLDEREQLAEDLRIDDVEIKRIRYRNQRTWARVDVEFTWHLDSRGIVHKTVTRQVWRREGNQWLIADEHRVRGEPMPGVAEPPDDAGDAAAAAAGSPGDASATAVGRAAPALR
ncbi:MAG: hypothetical protein D6689_15105 [Deltaproteobacteria bacterium]|nr:MAG: hypothetical protein D6689_15105 [Deltaproteobacteria bacterium]